MCALCHVAIDPGSKASGWVLFRPKDNAVGLDILDFGKTGNRELRIRLGAIPDESRGMLVIEMPRARGMPTSNDEFEMVAEVGRFLEKWDPRESGTLWSYVFRMDVKLHVCGSVRATDSNIRQSLIDMFGGKDKAIGGVKCSRCKGKGWFGPGRPVCVVCQGRKWTHPPGPLFGMTSDIWAALGVAMRWVSFPEEIYHRIPPPKTRKGKCKGVGGRR